MSDPDDVLAFWFEEAGPRKWFRGGEDFDGLCRLRYLETLEAAARGEYAHWRETPSGRCAEIIVLDQFSRNIFRGTPRAFSQDSRALACARDAVATGDHLHMDADERYFSYMPFMHSEELAMHREAERLFTELGNQEALRYEIAHRRVIERFGRYPARNAILGRESSPEELAYLEHNAGF